MKYEYCSIYDSPIGKIVLLAEEDYLVGSFFMDSNCSEYEESDKENRVLKMSKKWLDIYFSGTEPDFEIPVSLKGTEFQKEVWKHVKVIPYGCTTSYGRIAEKIAHKRGINRMSSQAVGTAIGKNPVSIFIPCHRVIKENGSLGQYAGNEDRKLFLLDLEGCIKRSDH